MKDDNEQTLSVISVLDALIRGEGYEYIYEFAYNVYKILLEKGIGRICAAAVLYALACDIGRGRNENIREQVDKRLLLSKEGADFICSVFCALYADDSLSVMKSEEYAGLDEFCSSEHEAVIEAYATWCYKGGSRQDYTCTYRLTIRVEDKNLLENDLKDKLDKNPFLKADDIYKLYVDRLREYITDKFEDYCTCDDYYPPVVDDFLYNCGEEIEDYLGKYGIKLISDDFDYRESDYYFR